MNNRIGTHTTGLEKAAEALERVQESITRTAAQIDEIRADIDRRKAEEGLAGYRTELRDGMPCPLCGAHHHPYTTHPPQPSDAEGLGNASPRTLLVRAPGEAQARARAPAEAGYDWRIVDVRAV